MARENYNPRSGRGRGQLYSSRGRGGGRKIQREIHRIGKALIRISQRTLDSTRIQLVDNKQ